MQFLLTLQRLIKVNKFKKFIIMKKIYILLLAVAVSGAVSAQVKKAKTAKKPKAVKEAVIKTDAVQKVEPVASISGIDPHAGHNHAAGSHDASAPAVAGMAEAPKGEDNLQIETTHDFGTIAQGKPVTYDFVIKNTGKGELKLDNVQAGCGCTTPSWQPGPYKAGESAKINVGFNAAAAGGFNKPVTITYNGGLSKVIYIKGEVVAAPATPAPEAKGTQILKQGGN